MFKTAFTILSLITLCASCNVDSDSTESSSSSIKTKQISPSSTILPTAKKNLVLEVSIVNINKQIEDEMSPMGYWEISKSYPQLKNESKNHLLDVINKEILTLVNKYTCDGLGDETFAIEDLYNTNKILSFSYETMWMCSTMPSPDSRAGTLNLNLQTGKPVILIDELLKSTEKGELLAFAQEKLYKKLQLIEQKNKIDCPPPSPINTFVINKSGIEVRSINTQHELSSCAASVQINKKELASFINPNSILLIE